MRTIGFTQVPWESFVSSGRWVATPGGSLVANWAGSSMSFSFIGSLLKIKVGTQTERRDQWNGGTLMLAVIATKEADSLKDTDQEERVTLVDPAAGSDVLILHITPLEERTKWKIQITLIDWASTFELDGFIVDDDASITPFPRSPDIPRILFIGDSVSVGFTSSDEHPIPLGCLDAFPYVAKRILERNSSTPQVDIELVAYPGWTLVSHPMEKDRDLVVGMSERFFHVSPWNATPFSPEHTSAAYSHPTSLVLALGTNDEAFCVGADRFSFQLETFLGRLIDMFSSLRSIWIVLPFHDFVELTAVTDTGLTPIFHTVLRRIKLKLSASDIYIKLCDLSLLLGAEDTSDGLHPTTQGHAKLGAEMARIIKEYYDNNIGSSGC